MIIDKHLEQFEELSILVHHPHMLLNLIAHLNDWQNYFNGDDDNTSEVMMMIVNCLMKRSKTHHTPSSDLDFNRLDQNPPETLSIVRINIKCYCKFASSSRSSSLLPWSSSSRLVVIMKTLPGPPLHHHHPDHHRCSCHHQGC